MPPLIHYAHNGDVNIAYQVVGAGPHDILMIPGWVSNLANGVCLRSPDPRWLP